MADTLTATSGEGVANDKDQAPASAGDTVLSDSTTSTSLSAATDKKADASLRGEEAGNSKLAAETNEFTNVDLDDTSAVEGIPLGSPEVVQRDVVPLSRRLSEFKSWSVTHVKCARQMISERFGKGSRTVDVQLDESIQALRDTQRKYLEILAHSRRLVAQLRTNIEVQRSLGDMFAEYAVRAPELQTEFKSNCGVQRQVARNGDSLLAILEAFCSNVQTLVSKTMDDTLLKVKDYEAARVEYDAFRADLESLRAALVQNPANATKKAKLEEAEKELESHKTKYDQMRSDMAVKLRFLDENRVCTSVGGVRHSLCVCCVRGQCCHSLFTNQKFNKKKKRKKEM